MSIEEQFPRDCWVDIETGHWGLVSNLRLLQQTDLPASMGSGDATPADFRSAAAERGLRISDPTPTDAVKHPDAVERDRETAAEWNTDCPAGEDAPSVVGPIRVACDGSALSNPSGPGGWAWFVDQDRWEADGVPQATNNQMELTALLRFLQATEHLPADHPTVIELDSQYVLNAVTKWSNGWARNGWRTASGGAVKNADAIREIVALLDGRTGTAFEWVRGHNGHPRNEGADCAARRAAEAVAAGLDVNKGPGGLTNPDRPCSSRA